ncbi:NAD-dependent deacetylase [Burkholderia sp. S171]|uniref:SIR2 family NAD-dependent protein deacylase n=1 Tax=Burkholderia sp. S171 TaxID=1641860 RepID=UPI00349F0446
MFTSNVDGQFQKAGFTEERIHECHGSIHRLQCIDACTGETWAANQFVPRLEAISCRLEDPVPCCPHCGEIARPNIVMFGDYDWIETHFERQRSRLYAWLSGTKKLLVVELGAGSAIPTVRAMSERNPPRVVRINPRESSISPRTGIGIAMGALDALQQIDAAR